MNNKEKYKKFCQKEDIPIFSQYWWLDAVANNNWDVALFEKNNIIWASMPYVKKKKGPFTVVGQPQKTQILGPYIKYPDNFRYYKKLSWEKEAMNALIDQLPKFDYFKQNFSYKITNWLPFYWRGFKQTTFYTYIIEPFEDLEEFWSQKVQKKARVAIKKAQKLVDVIESEDASKFYEMVQKTYQRQGLKVPYSKEFFLCLDRACKEHESRKIFFAVDKKTKEIHVALYIVWDKKSIYLLASGADPILRGSGAESLLEWKAIEFAHKEQKILDFEGSMRENIEAHARSLGFKQMPYFLITKSNSLLLNAWMCLKEMK